MPAISTYPKNFFTLNGKLIDLHHYEGGIITGEIVKDTGRDQVERKHIGGLSYEDFIFETRVNAQVKELIRKSWEGENSAITCSVLTTDAQLKVIHETEFSKSLLTEIIIPQCNSSSKDAAFFGFRIKPELIQIKKGDGSMINPKINSEKISLKANFKLELGNLPCTRVATIDSFSVKTIHAGKSQNPTIVADHAIDQTDIENIFLTISKADLSPWLEWYKAFVVDGKNSRSDELTGRLVFLGPNMRDELFAIKLGGVGIFRFERKMEAANEVSRFNVGLYCNYIEMEP